MGGRCSVRSSALVTPDASHIWQGFCRPGGDRCGLRLTRLRRTTEPDALIGPAISPLIAAALCVRPRPLLTRRQANDVNALKHVAPAFATMRRLAMRFRGVLRGGSVEKLDLWIEDARRSGIHAMRAFARGLSRDIEAVRAAVTLPWSNRTDRRPDQPAEDAEARHVRPCERRPPPRPHAARSGAPNAPRLRKILFKGN
jgi:hypothetical protein